MAGKARQRLKSNRNARMDSFTFSIGHAPLDRPHWTGMSDFGYRVVLDVPSLQS